VAGIALQQGGVAQLQGLKLGGHKGKHVREATCQPCKSPSTCCSHAFCLLQQHTFAHQMR